MPEYILQTYLKTYFTISQSNSYEFNSIDHMRLPDSRHGDDGPPHGLGDTLELKRLIVGCAKALCYVQRTAEQQHTSSHDNHKKSQLLHAR